MKYQGYVDLCHQSHIVGWAASSVGEGVPVAILVNGRTLTSNAPGTVRPDLTSHGISQQSGFLFVFPEPLAVDDTVEVLLPDGTQLNNSPCRTHAPRLRELLDGIDPATMDGLEIGPLDRPILSKRRHKVYYVDHASKEDLVIKYRSQPVETVSPDNIVPTDIIWPGGPLRPCIAEKLAFDFSIASHVIEHVPDPIGWLREISSVLKPGGLISLAVPHRDYTFDRYRRESDAADLLDAHLRKLTHPSARQVLDHLLNVSHGEPVDLTAPRIRQAVAHAVASDNKSYYLDVHCHVFTPRSFVSVFRVIALAGLIPLRLRRIFPHRPDSNEFVVSLERTDPDPETIAATYRLDEP